MARAARIARRSFIIGSAAVAGGVAFGVYQYHRDLPNPLQPGPGAASLNPWIIIDQDGVTLITGRAEMGQGVNTTLPALIAEELDIAWQDIRVQHGPVAPVYYNAGLMAHALYDKGYDRGAGLSALIEGLSVAPKTLGVQITGVSTSVTDAFDRLRQAGATAREVLKLAGAARIGVSVDAMATRNGMVIGPGGFEWRYADLAQDAAAIAPPRDVALRPASDWRYLGRAMPRTDMVAKSTGTAGYSIDVRLPGMKYATVRMAPRHGGTMAGFDATAALAMPGVDRVIDLGDGIAVIADTTWRAMQAADAVEITWAAMQGRDATQPDDTEQMMARIGMAFDDRPNSTLRNDGDIDDMPIAPEDRVIEAEYSAPFLAHATMEPMSATAHFTGDRIEVWSGCQTPSFAVDAIARATGLDQADVTLQVPFLGGGFGRRLEVDVVTLAARIARAVPGVPVQMTWSREEDMRHDFYRPAALARMRGVIRGGFAQALDVQVAAPSMLRQIVRRLTRAPLVGPDKMTVEGAFGQPYAIPHFRVRGYLSDLDVPVGSWRSVGHSFNGFFTECFIDEMARAARRDPLAFRLDLARREHPPSAGVLEAVADMSGWSGETPAGIGRGVAMVYGYGTAVAVVIEVSDRDGAVSIDRAWMACDVGRALDPAIIEAQMTSGLIFGLSAAVMQDITFQDGVVQQGNFPDFDALRLHQAPRIALRILETQDAIGGVGEPGTPPAAPALANAIHDLMGERIRHLPLNRTVDFVI